MPLAEAHYKAANCMSDKLSALSCLVSLPTTTKARQNAIDSFYKEAAGDALVLNKWFAIQV